MGDKRSYKSYSQGFKKEAVALVLNQGYSAPEAVRSLGIAANMLYRWRQKSKINDRGKSCPKMSVMN